MKQRGQTILAVIMWAGGISLSVAGLSYGIVISKFYKADIKIATQILKNSEQDTIMALLKQSSCVQNQNIAAIAKALKVNVVSDPNCK